jgi:hypothetical protein
MCQFGDWQFAGPIFADLKLPPNLRINNFFLTNTDLKCSEFELVLNEKKLPNNFVADYLVFLP